MKLALTVVVLALAIPSTSSAQTALGISKGMTAKELIAKGGKPDPKHRYWFDFSSSPVSDFTMMAVMATPKTGACKVTASAAFEANQSGDQVRSRFESLLSRLTEKYGSPSNTFDYVKSGALWKEDSEFMMALLKEERVLASYWVAGQGDARLPQGLKSIGLNASALNSSKAIIVVSYEFDNFGECIVLKKADNDAAL